MSNQVDSSSKSSSGLDTNNIEAKLHKIVDDYRELRDRLQARRGSYYEKIAKTYFKVASTPHAKPFFSIEGQQYCYNLAVLSIIFLSYVVFCYPQYFHHVYTVLMMILIIARYYFYKHLEWTPFCFDFCYFANYITMIALYTDHPTLLSAAYTVCHGPVLLALIMWRNSLVFHSHDKLTSCCIHFLPALALHLRLHVVTPLAQDAGSTQYLSHPFSFTHNVLVPLGYYLLWQLGYSLYFDFLNADLFKANPRLQSSLRWFVTTDYDTPLVQFALRTARKTGFFRPEDDLRDDEWKTKILFQSFQLAYTVITMPVSFLSYCFPHFSLIMLFVNLTYVINAGATFYLSTAFIKQRMAVVTKKFESQKRKQEASEQQQQPEQVVESSAQRIAEKIKKRNEELLQLQSQLDEIQKHREQEKLRKRSSKGKADMMAGIQADQQPSNASTSPVLDYSTPQQQEAFLEALVVGDESREAAPEGEGDMLSGTTIRPHSPSSASSSDNQ